MRINVDLSNICMQLDLIKLKVLFLAMLIYKCIRMKKNAFNTSHFNSIFEILKCVVLLWVIVFKEKGRKYI